MAQVPDHFAGSPPGGISHRVKIAGVLEGNDRGPGGDSQPVALQSEGDSTDLSATAMLVQRVTKRENSRDKAKRYLVEARLQVVRVDGDLIVAKCRGGGVVYDLGHDPEKAPHWRCTCPARGPCAHLLALQCVTAVER